VATTAEEYRAKAAECDQRAESSRDPDIKDALKDLARQWRELAAHADRTARGW